MKRLLLLAFITVATAVGLAAYGGLLGPSNKVSAGLPTSKPVELTVPVVDAEVRLSDVPVTVEAIGTVQALNSVLIRSQVDGRLVQLAVKEGSNVQRGDIVARIDPVVYQSTYEQAVAKKVQDEANLANAKVDLERYLTLSDRGFGPRQQTDTQRALVAQLNAQIQADQAAIDNAKAFLDYTVIRSPIDGRSGIRLVDEGNLIRASDGGGIVTITQIQPISLIFNLPQQQFRSVKDAMLRGTVRVQALDTEGIVLADGVMDVIDNQVDQSTGTVKFRGRFANDDLALWPGQFVNVRVFVDLLRQVVSIPSAAVQRGPDGAFVYKVSDDSKAVLTPVVIGRQDRETAVVAAGATPLERVIVTGFQRLADRTRVRVSPPSAAVSQQKPQGDIAVNR
jgi:membrane fusion protein, multidrug efflux system